MVGIETLAIVASSTCMKVPRARAIEVMARLTPAKGAGAAAVDVAVDMTGRSGSAIAGDVYGRLHRQADS